MIKLIGLLFYFVTLHCAAHEPAQRIISLSPHITELLFAAGGQNRIVGVINHSDYPAAAKHIPVIGDSHALDLERIILLKPDLIVIWRQGSSAKHIEQLKKLNVPLYFSEAHRLTDIPNDIEALAKLMGTEQQANKVADDLRNRLSMLTKQYSNQLPVRLFYQIWDKPLVTINGQQMVSDAIRVCGGVNVFSNQKMIAPNVSIEAVLQINPEAIVATSDQRSLAMWMRYPTIEAVKRGNLIELDSNLINRAGPRMILGVADLCQKLDQVRKKRS